MRQRSRRRTSERAARSWFKQLFHSSPRLEAPDRQTATEQDFDRLTPQVVDTKWYLTRYPDVALAQVDAQEHFNAFGQAEGRWPTDPTTQFDAEWYRFYYRDVMLAGLDPLTHFIEFGKDEGRFRNAWELLAATKDFDAAWYVEANPDVALSDLRPLDHYLRHGKSEGRFPNLRAQISEQVGFDAAWYISTYPDVSKAQLDPLDHYIEYGLIEGRFASNQEKKQSASIKLDDLCNPLRDERYNRESNQSFFVSVLTPTYNTDRRYIQELYQTLRNQTYTNWEWVVVDDGSSRAETVTTLREIAEVDARVRVTFSVHNGGISAASNAALCRVRGTHVALVDHDDLLPRDALWHVYSAWRDSPATDLFYTDECKLLPGNEIDQYWGKPDWSPAYLENTMCIGHLSVFESGFIQKLGGFRSQFDGTQDYDLALRASLNAPRVCHVPVFGYIWRAILGSAAMSINEKSYAVERQRAALLDYARQVNPKAEVERGFDVGYWRIRFPLPEKPPRVSYIIPTTGKSKLIRGLETELITNCISHLVQKTFYPDQEFVVVSRVGDLDDDIRERLSSLGRIIFVDYESSYFNYSATINLGVRASTGDILCLLNDDVEVITSDGGTEMVAYLLNNSNVGMIGPKCISEDGRIQQVGVVLLKNSGPGHAATTFPRTYGGPQCILHCRREVGCLGGAVTFLRRTAFDQLGGYAEDMPLNYNDVDFAIRMRKTGMTCIVDPYVEVYHFESATKHGTSRVEQEFLYYKHEDLHDPYYSKWLDSTAPFFRFDFGASNIANAPFEAWLDRHISRRSRSGPNHSMKITVGVSVFNQPRHLLTEMYDSVVMQTYEAVEFLILDNGSRNGETVAWLADVERQGRARIIRLTDNEGIVGGQRLLLDEATGDCFVPIDADDFLTLDALQMLALAKEQHPESMIFYSDEFKSNVQSQRLSPFVKPDFDPVLLMNCCYPAHLMMMDVRFMRTIDAYSDPATDWSHDYDTIVRALRAGQEPVHVRELLYAWRMNPGSTASGDPISKPGTVKSQAVALTRLIEDRGIGDIVSVVPNTLGANTGMWHLRASRPVESVQILAESEAWDDGGREIISRAREGGSTWIAVLREIGDAEALLALSALALFDRRILAVSGLVQDADTGTIHWSGGLFAANGVVFDPYAGQDFATGGYHGMLRCQRCVDIVAPVNVLLRADAVVRAADQLHVSASSDSLITMIGLDAHKHRELVAVTPLVRTETSSPLPLDREGVAFCSPALAGGSRWYDSRLPTDRPFDVTAMRSAAGEADCSLSMRPS